MGGDKLVLFVRMLLIDMSNALREEDSTRLITWASNRKEKDLNFHLADMISFNDYPGWYEGNTSSINRYDLRWANERKRSNGTFRKRYLLEKGS